MKIRTKLHYERMLANNRFATVGHTLAAYMIVAARRGLVDFDGDREEVAEISRRLRAEYGETLNLDEVKREMGLAAKQTSDPIETRDLKDWVEDRPWRGEGER